MSPALKREFAILSSQVQVRRWKTKGLWAGPLAVVSAGQAWLVTQG